MFSVIAMGAPAVSATSSRPTDRRVSTNRASRTSAGTASRPAAVVTTRAATAGSAPRVDTIAISAGRAGKKANGAAGYGSPSMSTVLSPYPRYPCSAMPRYH